MLTVEDKNFDWKSISLKDCLEGNALDAYFTGKIYCKLKEELHNVKLYKLYENLISPLQVILAEVEYNGLRIDINELNSLKDKIQSDLSKIDKGLRESRKVPSDINFNSTKDLIKVLYSLQREKGSKDWDVIEGVGFGLYPPLRTAAGQPSTDEETLVKLKEFLDKEFNRRGLQDGQEIKV